MARRSTRIRCSPGGGTDSGRGFCYAVGMERIIRLQIEKLPEGVYLATSDDVQGLLAQAETVEKVVEIARDVARMLLEMDMEQQLPPPIQDEFELPIVIAA